jgi:hypothetical protein
VRHAALLAVLLALGFLVATGCSRVASEGSDTAGETRGSFETSSDSYFDTSSESYSSDEYAPYADAQDAWNNQDGPDWEAFNDAYSSGWEEGCDLVFDESPDGYLYDQGDQYSADDCYGNEPYDATDADVPSEVPDDPQTAGEDLGTQDGCESAFEDLPLDGVFYYGEDEIDDSVCPVASGF